MADLLDQFMTPAGPPGQGDVLDKFIAAPQAPGGDVLDAYLPKEPLYGRFAKRAVGGFEEGTADVIDAIDYLGTLTSGGRKTPGEFSPGDLADWIRSKEPSVAAYSTTAEKATDIAGSVVGGIGPGVVGWEGKVPMAMMSGGALADRDAAQKGEKATWKSTLYDALVEGGGRKLMGMISAQQWGALTSAIGFGAVSGAQSEAEGASHEQSATNAGVNFLLGFIAPHITPNYKADLDNIKAANEAGNTEGAKRGLNKLLEQPGMREALSKAARTDRSADGSIPEDDPSYRLPQDQLTAGGGVNLMQLPDHSGEGERFPRNGLPAPPEHLALPAPTETPLDAKPQIAGIPKPATAAVRIDGHVFTGETHEQAVAKAASALGVSYQRALQRAEGRGYATAEGKYLTEEDALRYQRSQRLDPYEPPDQQLHSGRAPLPSDRAPAVQFPDDFVAQGAAAAAEAHAKSQPLVPYGDNLHPQPEPQRLPLVPATKEGLKVAKARTASTLNLIMAQRNRAKKLAHSFWVPFENSFKGVPVRQRFAWLDMYARGQTHKIPEPYRKFFTDHYKNRMDQEYVAERYGADIEYEYRKNYWWMTWTDPEKAELIGEQAALAGQGKASFQFSKMFDYPSEAAAAGLVPRITNPAHLALLREQAGILAASRVIAMHDLTMDGLAMPEKEWNKTKPEVTAGWQQLKVGGKMYRVHPTAAKMLEQSLLKAKTSFSEAVFGLSRHSNITVGEEVFWSAMMGIRNLTIPLKLAFSDFHAFHIAQIQFFQPFSELLKQGFNKEITWAQVLDGTRTSFGQGGRGVAAEGRSARDLWEKPYEKLNPNERAVLDILVAGGMTPDRSEAYSLHAEDSMRRAINDVIPEALETAAGKGLGPQTGVSAQKAKVLALARTATVVGVKFKQYMEALQKPLFEEWIPNMKVGSYLNMARHIMTAHPELLAGTPEAASALRDQLTRAAYQIDERFGEMDYEKRYWNPLVKRVLLGTMLSVGWEAGFIYQFGGAAKDIATLPWTKEMSSRSVYAGMYVAGSLLANYMMTMMMTGETPDTLQAKDGIYPRLSDGSRLTTMSFVREFGSIYYRFMQEGPEAIASLARDKLNPALGTFIYMLEGHDYFGNEIRDPNAPGWKQVLETMKWAQGNAFVPISVGSVAERGDSTPARIAMSTGGLNPAPAYATNDPFVEGVHTAYRAEHPQQLRPYAEAARDDEKRALHDLFKQWQKTKSPADRAAFEAAQEKMSEEGRTRQERGGIRHIEKAWDKPKGAIEFSQLDRASQTAKLNAADAFHRMMFKWFAHKDIRDTFPDMTPAEFQALSKDQQIELMKALISAKGADPRPFEPIARPGVMEAVR